MSAAMHDRFAHALLHPAAPVPPGLRTWNGSDPARRFAVHRNTVLHSLTAVLADGFPVLRQQVGDACFDALALAFIAEHPPRGPVLAEWGDRLGGWLEGVAPLAAMPWLPGLARLERARVLACHAADAAPGARAALEAALAAPAALARRTARLHPSLAVLRFEHAVVSLWAAHQHDDDTRDAALARLDLGTPEAALVLRDGFEVLVLPLPEPDFAFAAALARGATLGAAATAAPGADLGLTLGRLLRHGALLALPDPGDGR